ncbi:9-hexadecenoic acid cis-trans isomerase [Aliivibrio fischeri ES114]|uniref:9-hexadecenoic acid cis-trans isomerase n=2 Tax=Aliivibrio fischeri TaxID=668 RepID=Q5DZW4_ALIF1|nr:fatty acid cis/trans isomerase [Aliivibrio fischeri]AAW87682.1 9-hexadecenoic acid cis-trans isomerase [Aliivibrio fischeri ES114]KLU78163.1 9-hexadecenoic acid cis-trans isomerase [Aliivibrio fischeri]MUK45717.1 9-hexadecenoic acid cis-trans isomerase [Aliivibrio fischeri]MUK81566.1 9-hexadecenoic acid cis-trans isomerase [Aliivibrio fischeri]MUK86560.1 9-hexadecenoic acid cis-trans isomerase [Aliivibrio fischeri]
MFSKRSLLIAFVVIFSGCATYATYNYDQLFGEEQVQERIHEYKSPESIDYLDDVKPLIDKRCVVCHACYDAPCQLKMSSAEGIDRGAHKSKIYEGTRLVAANPTRLFEDAQTTQEWRDIGFSPVLNERDQNEIANTEAGVMARMLTLKQTNPLAKEKQLTGYDFSIDRDQQCPTIEEMSDYESQYPSWGMPYGMPELSNSEHDLLMNWLEQGAHMSDIAPLSDSDIANVEKWETFFNGNSLKEQLTARYLYEHLFLNHLYFTKDPNTLRFFKVVRSATPPGEPLSLIATRRPYDDPGVERVYYRVVPVRSSIVDKTHMPYLLDQERFEKWTKWFVTADYQVTSLPSYSTEIAANPLVTFVDLPVHSRYSYLLDEAQDTIQGFIKGPVCRGQLALNVINDHFWVFFVDPDKTDSPDVVKFYREQKENLALPAELDSTTVPITSWIQYSRNQARYLEAKNTYLNSIFSNGQHLTLDLIWNGNQTNDNAALTIYRHFDSASVIKGLNGPTPKTAWVIDYALLERIHYLLVAGFDVYGNFGHQLMTRMYMDFLRMEGESNFLALLPKKMRKAEFESWYQDPSPQLSRFLQRDVQPFEQPTQIKYISNNPKDELFTKLRKRMGSGLSTRYNVTNSELDKSSHIALNSIDRIQGDGLQYLPQIMTVKVVSNKGKSEFFTLLNTSAHKNISSLFNEEGNRIPKLDRLSILYGVVGSYPAAFLEIEESKLPDFVKQLSKVGSEEDYVALLDGYAIRRSSNKFWAYSDELTEWYKMKYPIEAGLLDYNRFENR